MVMVGLTVSMHFRQFEDLKFQFFLGEHALGPRKTLIWYLYPWPIILTLILFGTGC